MPLGLLQALTNGFMELPTSDIGAPSYTSSDNVEMLELPFVAVPSSGNDELSIKFF